MDARAPRLATTTDAFFLASPARAGGQRFCLLTTPAEPRATVVYVHPFAEEMNKSRRMVALQARAFAAAGIAVLQIDLFGCGDSCGDFASARWDQWLRDLTVAADWLAERGNGPMQLWGLRLGALRLQREDADQRLMVVAHVGALGGAEPHRHPPQAEQPDDVVDPHPADAPQRG